MKSWLLIKRRAPIFVLSSIVLLAGCAASQSASTPASGALDSRNSLSNTEEALEYKKDVAESAAMYERLLNQQFGDVIDGEVVVRPINGPDAWALLQQNDMTKPFEEVFNSYLERLLHREDALAFVYEIPPSMGAPTGAVFIPYPLVESFEKSPDRPESPGIFLLFGIEEHDASPAYHSGFTFMVSKTGARKLALLMSGNHLI